jgi:hypothetical protein
LLCWVVGVHCGIYKGSYHALNIRTWIHPLHQLSCTSLFS